MALRLASRSATVILHCNFEEIQALKAGARSFLDGGAEGPVPVREAAVAAYFDFAHALSVSHRLDELVAEMEALVELLTGEPADDEAALSFRFPV